MNNIQAFHKCWRKFVLRVKGKLLNHITGGDLDPAYANLVLKSVVADWESEYDEGGRWLKALRETDPEMGETILSCLRDASFAPVEVKGILPETTDLLVPVIGAIAGFGISGTLHATKAMRLLSVVFPAAILYPATKSVDASLRSKGLRDAVDGYMQQLEQLRIKITDILVAI